MESNFDMGFPVDEEVMNGGGTEDFLDEDDEDESEGNGEAFEEEF